MYDVPMNDQPVYVDEFQGFDITVLPVDQDGSGIWTVTFRVDRAGEQVVFPIRNCPGSWRSCEEARQAGIDAAREWIRSQAND